MIPVSIIIITKNEAAIIAKCIMACKPITDDIIIVDNGSADATVKIAGRMGCRAYLEKWEGYGANKNKGSLYAKYDWILSIDADEVVDEELICSLYGLSLDNPKIAYDFKFRSFFGKKLIRYGSWGNDHRIRLFNRNYVRWSTAKVHEKLLIPKSVKIKRLKGHIAHYTVRTSAECYQKAMYYANLSAEQYLSSNRKDVLLKLCFSPVFGFIRNYIIRFGFLDGREGWNIAINAYRNTWTKYYYLRQLQHKLDLNGIRPDTVKDYGIEYK
jgi:glycosyltransferase involved in cell wall biosynthesis